MKNKTTETGKLAESVAEEFLIRHRLQIVDKNFHSRFGEIDLIAKDKQILIFVEVRYRKNESIMHVIETIDTNKIKKLIATSEYFISKSPKYRNLQCRYDFIGILGNLDQPRIEWIKDAFQA